MSAWVVARRDDTGKWAMCPQVFDQTEADEYAEALATGGFRVVVVDLDSLSEKLPRREAT